VCYDNAGGWHRAAVGDGEVGSSVDSAIGERGRSRLKLNFQTRNNRNHTEFVGTVDGAFFILFSVVSLCRGDMREKV
jgi:hypothetical protein